MKLIHQFDIENCPWFCVFSLPSYILINENYNVYSNFVKSWLTLFSEYVDCCPCLNFGMLLFSKSDTF